MTDDDTRQTATADDDDDVLDVDAAAEYLRIGRNAVYDGCGRGDIPHRRIGRSIRMSRRALARWLAGSAVKP